MQYYFSPFPVDVFPERLAKYVRNVATAMVCPPDLVGALLLGTLSSAIGTSRVVQIKEGWTEPPVFYGAIVAPPSSKKSPVFKEVLRPVKKKQLALHQVYELARTQYKQELEIWEETEPKQRGPKPEKPLPVRNFFSDFTFEALAKLLEQNQKGLLLALDEIAAWVNSMDQYRKSKGADRDHWLSLWSCSMITVDRSSREEPIVIPRPFVSVIGGVQPDRLKIFKGKDHDGFIDRILFAYPEEMPNEWTDVTVAKMLRQQYQDLYDQLYALEPELTPEGTSQPIALGFSPSARNDFIKVVTINNDDINREGDPFLKSAFSKMEAYFFRFTLLLQLCHDPNSHQIEEEAVQGAMLLLQYFKDQARKVYATIEGSEVNSKNHRALEALNTHGEPMTLRDCYTKKVAGVKTAGAARKLFDDLEKEGYGKIRQQQNSSGGKPTITFHLRQCDCDSCNQQSPLRRVK